MSLGLGLAGCNEGRVWFVVSHMLCYTVQNLTHSYHYALPGNLVTKAFCAIWGSKDCFSYVSADFALVDVEGSYHLYILGSVITNLVMHYACGVLFSSGTVIFNALYQRARAIPNTDDGGSDLPRIRHSNYSSSKQRPERLAS